jgi:hypothetical protein
MANRSSQSSVPQQTKWDSIWRAVGISVAAAGVVGGVVGLIIGLFAYPPTAWFAIIELGLPSALLGGVIALLVAGIYYSIVTDSGRD